VVAGVLGIGPAAADKRIEIVPYAGFRTGGDFEFQDVQQHANVDSQGSLALAKGSTFVEVRMSGLREVDQSLELFDLVLVFFTTLCASGAGAGLPSGGVVTGGVASRLF
jgi:hypothetical protein